MIEINNLTARKVSEKFLSKVADAVLRAEKRKGDISIAIVDGTRIRELNRKYRKKDKETDVLSFLAEGDKFNAGENYLGEIVMCPGYIERSAKEAESDFQKELVRALIHSILHLLGYDHEKSKSESDKMENRENYLISKIDF